MITNIPVHTGNEAAFVTTSNNCKGTKLNGRSAQLLVALIPGYTTDCVKRYISQHYCML